MKNIFFLVIFLCVSPSLFGQDTLQYKPVKLIKVSAAYPLFFIANPIFGMKYFGISYEQSRSKKTSWNFYFDYFHRKQGYITNTGIYEPDLNDDKKSIYSFRFLYRWYPFKRKWLKGFYASGGINMAFAISHYSIGNMHGSELDGCYGLGFGFGHRWMIKNKVSIEMLMHSADNASKFYRDFGYQYNSDPIGIFIMDVTVGYKFNK